MTISKIRVAECPIDGCRHMYKLAARVRAPDIGDMLDHVRDAHPDAFQQWSELKRQETQARAEVNAAHVRVSQKWKELTGFDWA